MLAAELRRVVDTYGNEALYGGSYGWASAGRFHHAQSQVHRFLKMLGGYTFSKHSYSLGATGVIMPRVVGTHDDLFQRATQWDVIVEHTDLLVCFGGVNLKNTGINCGGTTGHPAREALEQFRDKGGAIVSISPLRGDVDGDAEWLPAVPGTDVAIMLALAHVLATEGLADREFLATYCTGYERFERYLLGADDGVPKSPQWAAAICGLDAEALTSLARRMAACRTIVTVSWSLQRQRHGEQAPWMGLTLAAMLGQIGLPGGGFGHGYGSMNEPGLPPLRFRLPSLPQGPNPVHTFIPVAAISDMLLHPGETFTYNGLTPDLSGHQVRVLGRRQPLSPPPEPAPAAARTRPRRHRRGARPVLDADGPPRRHRRPVDHGLRTRRLLRIAQRSAARGDAGARRALRAVARRLHDLRRAGRPPRFRRAVHRRPQRPRVAGAPVREVVGRNRFRRSRLRPVLGRRRGAPPGGNRADAACRLPRRPADPSACHTERADRDLLGDHRRTSATRTAPDIRGGMPPPSGWAASGPSATRCI